MRMSLKNQRSLWYLPPIKNDVVYTPTAVAKDIIDWCNPIGSCLDPCLGDGSFFEHLPSPKQWCEIEKGKDFFDHKDKYDWIIGNPPYSIFEDWIIHSFELGDNIVYLLPTNKVFQRHAIMSIINSYGGIFGMRIYGSGQKICLPFGFSVGAFHFKRDWKGKTDISFKIEWDARAKTN